MKKISRNEAFKSTKMFLIDASIENRYEVLIKRGVAELEKKANNLTTVGNLISFIKSEKDSVNDICVILGVSQEKFKRIFSLLRLKLGYTFDSECSLDSMRGHLIKHPELMENFCQLLINGPKNNDFAQLIPKFLLDDFYITPEVISRFSNKDYLTRLVKAALNTQYNADYCALYVVNLSSFIKDVCKRFGLTYETKELKGVPGINSIITDGVKSIIVTSNFYLTTSSSQTSYAEKTIRPIFQSIRTMPEVILVNFLDGAGWIGRGSDYYKVYSDCTYFINYEHKERLVEIIKEHFNISE